MKYFLLVEDHEIVRSGVKNILSEIYKPCEVYEATDRKSVIQPLINHPYDLVLVEEQSQKLLNSKKNNFHVML